MPFNKNDKWAIEDSFPLTPLQEGLLFQHLSNHQQSGLSVMQLFRSFEGHLHLPSFYKAWSLTFQRHSSLRSAMKWEGLKKPIQEIHKQVDVPIQYFDWRHLSRAFQKERLEKYFVEDRHAGFDVAKPPLARIALFQIGDNSYEMIWTYHHLILDGSSIRIMMDDFKKFYKECAEGEVSQWTPAIPYREFAHWVSQRDFAKEKSFWAEALKGFKSPTPLLPGKHKPDAPISRDYEWKILSEEFTQKLDQVAKAHGLSANRVLQGAWGLLLSLYAGDPDVIFGVIVSGRARELKNSNEIVGLCLNTVPFRIKVENDKPLMKWLMDLEQNWMKIRENPALLPLAQIKHQSEVSGDQGLFDSVVNFHLLENAQGGIQDFVKDLKMSAEGHRLRMGNNWTEYTLALNIIRGRDTVVRIDFDNIRYDHESMARMLGHFEQLLLQMVEQPEQMVGKLTLITKTEEEQILHAWNATEKVYPDHDKTLNEIIEQQVRKTPNAVALTFQKQNLTYEELNSRANQLAHYLRKMGVGPDVLVGICINRSIEMVVGLLAIVKAGGAYVPIDPEYPEDRQKFMLDDIQPPILLTQGELAKNLSVSCQVLCLDTEWHKVAQEKTQNLDRFVKGDGLAYGIYTSGSTGKPKCALNTHEAIVNRLLWMQEAYQLTSADHILQKTPFSFDVSVWEFFWPLMTGARLVVANPGGHRDPSYLIEIINQEKITTLHFVPSMLQAFLTDPDVVTCQSLKRVICSGEALPFDLQNRFFSYFQCELHNLYGPTEAAVDVSYWACEKNPTHHTVPIGRPIANMQLYILDTNFKPVPVGIAGELFIGGIGLARGYWNREELTREKFISNPLSSDPKSRLYKTGDLCRFSADGSIEYLGRMDHQVKIRGLRIELGEIESALCEHPAIREAVVVAFENARKEKQLAGYFVADREIEDSEIRSHLEKNLPNHMIPAAFVKLDVMPLSPNGKVDRKALPAPQQNNLPPREFVMPLGVTEQFLASVWQDVLGVSPVGVTDNYFSLGGDSLRAIQIVLAAKKAGIKLNPIDILKHPTIQSLSQHLSKMSHDGVSQIPYHLLKVPADLRANLPQDIEDVYPITRMQNMVIRSFNADKKRIGVYHFQKILQIQDVSLSVPGLKQSLEFLFQKHPIFRTYFVRDERGDHFQVVLPRLSEKNRSQVFQSVDLRHLGAAEQEKFIQNHFEEDRLKGFDIYKPDELPYRFIVYQKSDTSADLLMSLHHAICDGWGNVEFVNELFEKYKKLKTDSHLTLEKKANVFKEFVALEKEMLDSKEANDFWYNSTKNLRPLSFKRIKMEGANVPNQAYSLLLKNTAVLNDLAKRLQVSLKTIFLSAYFDLIAEETGSPHPVIGVLSNGRSERLSEPLKALGLFWNILPFACKINRHDKLAQIEELQHNFLAVEPFIRMPLEKILEISERRELFPASFNFIYFHNTKAVGKEEDGMKVSTGALSDLYHFPFNLAIVVDPADLKARIRIESDNLYFDESTLRRLADRYAVLLEEYIALSTSGRVSSF